MHSGGKSLKGGQNKARQREIEKQIETDRQRERKRQTQGRRETDRDKERKAFFIFIH